MLCVFCRALDAEDFYIDGATQVWICSPFCLENYLYEKWSKPAGIATTKSEGSGGAVDTPTGVSGVQEEL